MAATATTRHSWPPLLLLLVLLTLVWQSSGLPITSRPIEESARGLPWDNWAQEPGPQQKAKVPKSIFTLPYHHCPTGHKQFEGRCISRININATELLKEELIQLVTGGVASGNVDKNKHPVDYEYDYDVGLGLNVDVDDQELPSEDVPLKFNLFERKFLMSTTDVPPPNYQFGNQGNATTATTTTSTTAVALNNNNNSSEHNRTINHINTIAEMLAVASNTMTATTTTIAAAINRFANHSSASFPFDYIAVIMVPVGLPDAVPGAATSVGVSLEPRSQPTTTTTSADYHQEAVQLLTREEQAITDLNRLLKAETFLTAYPKNTNTLPTFSHRRVTNIQSANISHDELPELAQGEARTDIVPSSAPVEQEAPIGMDQLAITPTLPLDVAADTLAEQLTTTISSTTVKAFVTPITQKAATHPQMPQQQLQPASEHENEFVLKKSKVEPVQLRPTTPATLSTTATTITIARGTAADDDNAATIQAGRAVDEADDDRFYYQYYGVTQPQEDDVAGSSTTTDRNDMMSDMAASGNLMINTIAGQPETKRGAAGVTVASNKKSNEINFKQEVRIINELVNGNSSSSTAVATTATQLPDEPTSVATTAEIAAIWPQLMPILNGTATIATKIKADQLAVSAMHDADAHSAAPQFSINIDHSNKNSKIIRINKLNEQSATNTAAAGKITAASTSAANITPSTLAPATTISTNSNSAENVAPFWLLPIGWRLERSVDTNGQDRSLLLRFFSNFGAASHDLGTAATNWQQER